MDANKIDVDALFKQYTIKEIQAIELQVKNEIEKKKEDLRIMVYNRYRDIIDAADGIHVMKSCSQQIRTVLGDLQVTCDNVFSDKENTEFINQSKLKTIERNKRNNKYVLAVIIKILQNSPSKIWYHLDNEEYIKAAKQYLLAQHAHVCLELESNLKILENSSNHIIYANELWSSIVFLSKTIATKARETFTNLNIESSKVLVDAMSAIYLLENIKLPHIFNEFINNRTPMIRSVIDISMTEQGSSIKDRILKCLKSLVNTVNHIYNLFSNDPGNKIQSFEASVNESFIVESLKDDGFVISKIPNYLKNLKFKDSSHLKRFESSFLNEKANEWLNKCLIDLQEGLARTFKYVNSLKNLVSIRDLVVEFESNIQNINGQHEKWTTVCNVLFNKEVPIWSQLIAPYYYAQSKLIIESSFETTHDSLVKSIHDCLSVKSFDSDETSPEFDINSYIWSMENQSFTSLSLTTNTKSPIDFISNKLPSSTRSTNVQHNITPAIKRLCNILDNDLHCLLDDIELATSFTNKSSSIMPFQNMITNVVTEDFDSFYKYLEIHLKSFSNKLTLSLAKIIQDLGLNTSDDLRIKKILLVCRFTNAISTSSSPQLKACFNSISQQFLKQKKSQLVAKVSAEPSDLIQILSSAKKKSLLAEQKSIDSNWGQFVDDLQITCKAGFKIWIESICLEIKRNHLNNLNDSYISSEHNLAVNDLIAWDEIEIEDEPSEVSNNDTENITKSKLYAPLVCSPSIQSILYNLCQQLTRNLSYNMIDSNLILKDLIAKVFKLIISSYKNVVCEQKDLVDSDEKRIRLTQNQSLQMIFDLRFLYTLFDMKTSNQSEVNEEYKQVLADLETFIDPFDYDICLPFMQSNITKSISRTAALYGVLNTNERFGRSNFSTGVATANDKFNVLVLSNNQHRFELLPLPSQQSQQQLQIEKQQSLLLKNQANMKMDSTNKKSSSMSTSKQLADSASAGLSNVFKWFQ